jgi:hypothetical protein
MVIHVVKVIPVIQVFPVIQVPLSVNRPAVTQTDKFAAAAMFAIYLQIKPPVMPGFVFPAGNPTVKYAVQGMPVIRGLNVTWLQVTVVPAAVTGMSVVQETHVILGLCVAAQPVRYVEPRVTPAVQAAPVILV